MQSLCLVVDAEPPVPRLGHQPGELRLVQVDECRVIPAFEIHVGLRLDADVDDDIQFVSLANRGSGCRRRGRHRLALDRSCFEPRLNLVEPPCPDVRRQLASGDLFIVKRLHHDNGR